MEQQSKKYKCERCGKEAKQLNLDRETRKWVCNECFFNPKADVEILQEKGNVI